MVKPKAWMVTIFSTLNGLLYLVVLGMWISMPEEWMLNSLTTIACLMITVGVILFNREYFKTFYTSRYFKSLVNALISCFLLFVVLGFSNFLSYKNAFYWDITSQKRNSLTQQSLGVLNSLDKELKILCFSAKSHIPVIRRLLDLYRFSHSKISYEFIDAELRPDLVKKHGITRIPALALMYAGKKELVGQFNELALTNGIIKVSKERDSTIYYLAGHGELNLVSSENDGGMALHEFLKNQSFQIQLLELVEKDRVPKDAGALIIWGPRSGLFPGELEKIRSYLKNGGKVLLALDPNPNEKEPHELRKLLREFGIGLGNNFVIDRIKHIKGSNGTVPIIHKFNPIHDASKMAKSPVFLPLASSLEIDQEHEKGSNSTIIAQSSAYPAAWAENSMAEFLDSKMVFKSGEDEKGPNGLALVYEKEQSRMAVVGNSTFVINSYRKFPNNYMFFSNLLSWVVGEDRLISFDSPQVEDKPLFISGNQKGVIFYFSVIFAPLVLFLVAFVLYKRRARS
jgi:ABC-type uncharacterized transport system involved in gliding motility auxiliary subunit